MSNEEVPVVGAFSRICLTASSKGSLLLTSILNFHSSPLMMCKLTTVLSYSPLWVWYCKGLGIFGGCGAGLPRKVITSELHECTWYNRSSHCPLFGRSIPAVQYWMIALCTGIWWHSQQCLLCLAESIQPVQVSFHTWSALFSIAQWDNRNCEDW